MTTTNRLMLFREIIAVYWKNHTKHINTLCSSLMLNPVVYIVTAVHTGLEDNVLFYTPKRVPITPAPDVYRNTSHSKIPRHLCKSVRRYKGVQTPKVTRHITRTTRAVFRKKTSAVGCLHVQVSGCDFKRVCKNKDPFRSSLFGRNKKGTKSFTRRPFNYPLR
jgi:hypothetical protein